MASREFLENRIAGAQKKVESLQKKLGRIQDALNTNWEKNPYYYTYSDLTYCRRDLAEAKKSLEKYTAQLDEEIRKASSRNVPAITEFLDHWKERMRDYYHSTFARYPEARATYEKDMEQFNLGYFAERKLKNEDFAKWLEYDEARHNVQESFRIQFGFIEVYVERAFNKETMTREWSFNEERLEKDLTEEYNRKYDFIIDRTLKIVSEIVDASNLKVGAKGDLNGFIIGTTGKASVQTIGAGGYNIQCFHFRTLIHKLK